MDTATSLTLSSELACHVTDGASAQAAQRLNSKCIQIFIHYDGAILVSEIGYLDTPSDLKRAIESRLGVNPLAQKLYSGRRQLDDERSLESQLFMSKASTEPSVYLSYSLLGGGDRNTAEGSQSVMQSVGLTNSQNDYSSMDGSLADLLQELFPRQQQKYKRILVEHDLVTCEAVAELEPDYLIKLGFSEPNSRRLLAHCCVSPVALCINDTSNCVGHIQASPPMSLCRLRKTIEDGHFPDVPSSFSFTHRGKCVTRQQEQSWQLKQVLTAGDEIIVVAIATGELAFEDACLPRPSAQSNDDSSTKCVTISDLEHEQKQIVEPVGETHYSDPFLANVAQDEFHVAIVEQQVLTAASQTSMTNEKQPSSCDGDIGETDDTTVQTDVLDGTSLSRYFGIEDTSDTRITGISQDDPTKSTLSEIDKQAQAVQQSLRQWDVDAQIADTNPYGSQAGSVVEMSSVFVKTRGNKDRVMVFYARRNPQQNKLIVKNLRKFLKGCLGLSGCGALTLVNDCKTYTNCGPFQVVQDDRNVQVLTEQLFIEDNGRSLIIKFVITNDAPSIFSCNLSRRLKELNGIAINVGKDCTISEQSTVKTEGDTKLPSVDVSRIRCSDVRQAAVKNARKDVSFKPAVQEKVAEIGTLFEDFRQCSLNRATHFFFDLESSSHFQGISVSQVESLHEALAAYWQKGTEYNVYQMMTEGRTLLVTRFKGVDPTEGGVLSVVQKSVRGQKVATLSAQQECLVCVYGNDNFDVYWPKIELHCSRGQNIREAILLDLQSNFSGQQWEKVLDDPYESQSMPMVGSCDSLNGHFKVLGMFSSEGTLIRQEKELMSNFKLLLELTDLRRDRNTEGLSAYGSSVDECRPFGRAGSLWTYRQNSILPAEGREREYKSLNRCPKVKIPFKIVDYGVKFVVGCLNVRLPGVIAFGIGDQQEQQGKFGHGQVLGLSIEGLQDDIGKMFQYMLDNMIRNDKRHDQTLPPIEQQCISLHIINVVPQRNQLHVVEIEVNPDVSVCKGNVYIARIHEKKVPAKDLKAVPDDWRWPSDYALQRDYTPFIREAAGTKRLSWPDFMKHKTATEDKYKHEVETAKRDKALKLPPDEESVCQLSGRLQRVLHDLAFDRYEYILVSNAVPGELREGPELEFLAEIPWKAIFDFDNSSETGGLYDIMKRKLDNDEGVGSVLSRQVTILDVTDFKDRHPFSNWDKTLGSSHRTSWIFANGRKNVSPTQESYSDWVGNCRDPAEVALKMYLSAQKATVAIFAILSSISLEEIAFLLQAAYSILGPRTSKKEIAVICQDNGIMQQLLRLARVDVGECSVVGLPWTHVKENVRQMLNGRGELFGCFFDKHVVSYTGTPLAVPAQTVRTWEDIDVVGYYECEGEHSDLAIETSRDNFYKGHQPEWLNFYLRHEIDRSQFRRIREEVQRRLDSLRGPNFGQERANKTHIRVVVVHHFPGTGGTTLCRRLLWEFRKTNRCALIKAITADTATQIRSLYEFKESLAASGAVLPVFLVADSVDEHALHSLLSTLDRSHVKSVTLQCRPILDETQKKKRKSYGDYEFYLDRTLSKSEVTLVNGLISNLEPDKQKRTQIIRSIKTNKQILYFGLQLFGQDYNQKLLEKFVISHLDNVSWLEGAMLKFCSLVYTYMHVGIPRASVQSLLSGFEGQCRVSMADISETTADLIVLNTEGFDKYVYEGYRPAHHLVGVEILRPFRLLDTAVQFLEKMVGRRAEYAADILTDIAICLFTRREAKVDPDEENIDEDVEIVPGSIFEYAERVQDQRFSRLITTLMKEEGKFEALRVLLILCEKTLQSSANAFVWQHLARYLAYEIGEMELPEESARFLLSLLSGKPFWSQIDQDEDVVRLMESVEKCTGYEAAVKAINMAVEQDKSRSSFLTTKGLVYKLQLSPYKPRRCSVDQLFEVIQIARLSVEAFELAGNCPSSFINWHSKIGDIEVCLDVLAIVKDSELFEDFLASPDRKTAFRSFMDGVSKSKKLNALDPGQRRFIQEMEGRIRSMLDHIFEFEYLTRGWDRERRYGYQSAQARGARLRRKFVKVSECQYTVDLAKKQKNMKTVPDLRRQMVEEMLYTRNEDPYSSWGNFNDKDLCEIVRWLKPCCIPGKGGLNTDTDTTFLMLVRAFLEGRGADTTTITTNELLLIVDYWCKSKPQSAWAHLFQYMLYFPLPLSVFHPDKTVVRHAINCCQKIMREQYRSRKSRPLYFVGKEDGLSMIVAAAKVSADHYEINTKFWRSKRVMSMLRRLRGTKHKFGLILYQGIEISFDNKLYPKESKDWLWFYMGFTIQGPYAYDPVDKETYDELSSIDLATLPDTPPAVLSRPQQYSKGRTERQDRRYFRERTPKSETRLQLRDVETTDAQQLPLVDTTGSNGQGTGNSHGTSQFVSSSNRRYADVSEHALPTGNVPRGSFVTEHRQAVSLHRPNLSTREVRLEQIQQESHRSSGTAVPEAALDASKTWIEKQSYVAGTVRSNVREQPIFSAGKEATLGTEMLVSQPKSFTSTLQSEKAFCQYGKDMYAKRQRQPASTDLFSLPTRNEESDVADFLSVVAGKHRVEGIAAGRKAKTTYDYRAANTGSASRSDSKSYSAGKPSWSIDIDQLIYQRSPSGSNEGSAFGVDNMLGPSAANSGTSRNYSAILIDGLDSGILDESILQVVQELDKSAQLLRVSGACAVAFCRDARTATATQKELNGFGLTQKNKLIVAVLPPEAVDQIIKSPDIAKVKPVAERLDYSDSVSQTEPDRLLQEELFIFRTQLLESLDNVDLDRCSREAERIFHVARTIDFLNITVELIVNKGCKKPNEMTVLCQQLQGRKLSVCQGSKVSRFRDLMLDYCSRKFHEDMKEAQFQVSLTRTPSVNLKELVQFLARLYQKEVLECSLIHDVISTLLRGRYAVFYLCAQAVLRDSGRKLEDEDRKSVDQYFQTVKDILTFERLDDSTRLLLKNLIELRRTCWFDVATLRS